MCCRVRKYEEDLVSKSCDNLVQQQLLERFRANSSSLYQFDAWSCLTSQTFKVNLTICRTQLSSTLIKVLFPGEYGSVNEETRK